MKYTNLRAFEKHLEGAAPDHFSDIYMVLAKEGFERKSALDTLTKLVLKEEKAPDLCVQVFDAERHGVDIVLRELEAFSFFAKKRLIIVHNVDQFDKAAMVKLEAYFAAPNRSLCLALTAPAVNRATTFYKKTEKYGIILDVAEQKPWEREKSLADWLKAQAASAGKRLDPATCQLLLKQLGTDQSLLHQEVLKLICYVGERPAINQQDVVAVTGSINTENAWQLGEVIFRRQSASALRISRALLDDGVATIALLRQIRSQFQTEFNICTMLTNGATGEDITREYPYIRGQVLERRIQQALGYGLSRFKEGLLEIDKAEFQAKNSAMAPDFLTDMLMVKLTT